jgi:predicted GNAT family acetyltransferase
MDIVYKLAMQDRARNYFVCQTMIKSKSTYETVWLTEDESAAVLKRKSGTVQIIVDDKKQSLGVYKEVYRQLMQMDWKRVIATAALKDALVSLGLPVTIKPGSFIARCMPEDWISHPVSHKGERLEIEDLEEVVSLYRRVFTGFSSLDYMTGKILSGRGRGIIVREKGELLAVSQTDFESEYFALIVGVASHPDFRKMGYGEASFKLLGDLLVAEGKTLDLIYENPLAGCLYEKYGFKVYDQNYHMERI